MLAIATFASICAAGHAIATTTDMPLPRRAPSFGLTLVAGHDSGNVWQMARHHRVGGTGRHVGDAIELTIEGVKEPLTVTRMK